MYQIADLIVGLLTLATSFSENAPSFNQKCCYSNRVSPMNQLNSLSSNGANVEDRVAGEQLTETHGRKLALAPTCRASHYLVAHRE
jgi:hypothetical protein